MFLQGMQEVGTYKNYKTCWTWNNAFALYKYMHSMKIGTFLFLWA